MRKIRILYTIPNFDTAGSLLQYINYAFDNKEAGMDIPIGSNLRNTKGQFSIATKEDNKFYEKFLNATFYYF